ncbi:molybdenum cofactor guanylyltransferase MobA [Roseateles sp. BYS87W]|uniref:Molybdenum cofactor guanylyltransferase n=1 Tax=Pelomonas baiyunensis TaxID=3299026 RepID=A0ABW7GWC8_9BURK
MTPAPIVGLVLAGGRGTRMGGVDKGLQPWHGRPLAAHVLDALAPQVQSLMVSANRHLDAYAALGVPVLPDPPAYAFAGPLAGMLAGLLAVPDDTWLLTVPCDSPQLPSDLAARLWAAALPHGLAFVQAEREHPTHALLHTRHRATLDAALAQGQHAVLRWMRSQPHGVAQFNAPGAFVNFNHLTDLHPPAHG